MVQFITKRLIGLIFVVIGVSFITFIMGYFSPIDPVRVMLGQHFTPDTYNSIRHQYGLDLPWYQQYFNFLVRLLHFDLGVSFHYRGLSVWELIKGKVPVSIELGLGALIVQLAIGVPLGILSAIKANSWIDLINMGTLLIFYSVPTFVLAVFARMLIVYLNLNFNLAWPPTGWGEVGDYSWTSLQPKIVPILVLGISGAAYIARLMRTIMVEVLHQDYIRTARAKGLSERVVIRKHALRNALIPVVTLLGLSLAFLVVGAFFTESIFNIPGIASASIDAVSNRDFTILQGTTILLALAVVLGNLLSDILYTIVDPRIKIE
jgi:ABC-type dipeptide/oligopeptide/nickel transport system permease component